MAEAPKGVDWPVLHAALMPLRKRVQLFPIPADDGRPMAVGLSVPQRQCDDLGWEEFTQLFEVMRTKFAMEVYDLATGEKVTPESLDSCKSGFICEQ
jgi:hypothetical protein